MGAGSGSREPERLLNQSCTESGEAAYCIGHIACHVGSADCDAVVREGKACSVRRAGWRSGYTVLRIVIESMR